MGKFLYILVLLVIVAGAFAAPKDDADTKEVVATKPEKASTTAEERNVLVADDTWSTWMKSSSWPIITGSLGAIFLAAGLGVAFYYYYYVTNVHTYDSNFQGTPNSYGSYNYPSSTTYARALDLGSNWNFTKVLEYIDIAQKTYEGFDWYKLDCQKRALCELSQKDTWAGETGRKIANNYMLSVMDALDGIPIPKAIQAYLQSYKEAISQGKNSSKDCGAVYNQCNFSIKEVIANAGKPKKNTF